MVSKLNISKFKIDIVQFRPITKTESFFIYKCTIIIRLYIYLRVKEFRLAVNVRYFVINCVCYACINFLGLYQLFHILRRIKLFSFGGYRICSLLCAYYAVMFASN